MVARASVGGEVAQAQEHLRGLADGDLVVCVLRRQRMQAVQRQGDVGAPGRLQGALAGAERVGEAPGLDGALAHELAPLMAETLAGASAQQALSRRWGRRPWP